METISFKYSDPSGRNFDFETGNKFLGKLSLMSEFTPNGNFTTGNDFVHFRKAGIGSDVLVKKHDHLLGEIKYSLVGRPVLKLKNNRTYELSSNLWGGDLKWIDEDGVPVIEYTMPTINSMRRGTVIASNLLNKEDKEILLGAGLIARRQHLYQAVFFVLAAIVAFQILDKLF